MALSVGSATRRATLAVACRDDRADIELLDSVGGRCVEAIPNGTEFAVLLDDGHEHVRLAGDDHEHVSVVIRNQPKTAGWAKKADLDFPGSSAPLQEVMLHVYDIGTADAMPTVNTVLKAVGNGAYHAAVQAGEQEWSYGFIDEGTGVFPGVPKQCAMHTYRKSKSLGFTKKTTAEIDEILKRLEREWRGLDYDLLRHNCCHFSRAFAAELGVSDVPQWLFRTADAGATVEDGMSFVASGMDHVKSEGKRVRGRDASSGYAIGDVTIGLVSALARAGGEVIADGKESRGQGRDSSYQFGDFTRGFGKRLSGR